MPPRTAPESSFPVLEVAGHNLQIEQPALFDALMTDWPDRIAAKHPIPQQPWLSSEPGHRSHTAGAA